MKKRKDKPAAEQKTQDRKHEVEKKKGEALGESRERELVRQKEERFDPERWAKALEHKKQMSQPGRVDHDPGLLAVKKLDLKSGAAFISDGRAKVQVRKAKNPDSKASFGFAGDTFEVKGKSLKGTLIVRLSSKPGIDTHVGVDTVRLFRWSRQLKRFEMLTRSGAFQGKYVWGRVTQPGVYVPIGLPTHPYVMQTLRLLCAAGDLMLITPNPVMQRIRDRICEVILCAPDLARALDDPSFVRALEALGELSGYPHPQDDWPRPGPGSNLCELCFGRHAGPLPECELIPRPGGGHGCVDTGWVDVGPRNFAGCALQVAVDPNQPQRVYAASADGGIWQINNVAGYPTTSGWTPLTDQQDTLSTTAVAVAEFDSRVVYYTDALARLMRSDDRGATWYPTSSTNVGFTRRILVHPSDPDVVFLATNGGFLGSADGGAHWATLLAGDALDAAMDPEDSSVLYVGIRNEGIYKSYTAGSVWRLALNWTNATAPANTMIKVALGSQGTEATRMVAARLGDEVFVNRNGGRPPTATGGGPWTSRGNVGFAQGDWDHVIAVDPFDDNVILSGGTQLFRSPDAGVTWPTVINYYSPHEDQQGLAFDPVNRDVVYVANDGGIYRSTDGGVTWIILTPSYDQNREIRERRDLNSGLVTVQFYHVGVSGNRAVGNLYHSGIIGTQVLDTGVWTGVEGHSWEFSNTFGDPKRADAFYVFGGTQLWRRLFPPPAGVPALHAITPTAPPAAQISPRCVAADSRPGSGILLIGTNNPGRVMRTEDADRRTFVGTNLNPPMAWAAEPGIDVAGDVVTSITFAPSAPATVYAALESGRVFRKNDISTAVAWEELTDCGITGVRELAVAANALGHLYVVNADQVRFSDDNGTTWQDRLGTGTDTLPVSEFNSIVTHPRDAETIFVGADIGVFISTDEGQHWHPFDAGLPNAQVLQIFWRNGWLYAVTYGRGLWRRSPCL